MTGFLNTDVEKALTRVHPKQIIGLIALLSNSARRNVDFVAARYCEHSQDFAETLWFLKEIGWVREAGGILKLAPQARPDPAATRIQNATALMEAISNYKGQVTDALCGYLAKFSSHKNVISFQPSAQDKLDRRGIRNLLMELAVVSHDSDNDRYILDADFVDLYLWAQNMQGTPSKDKFRTLTEQRDELGMAAEVMALQFEKERVGPAWSQRVKHISAARPGACYDIKSVTVSERTPLSRFIEVKAVPGQTLRFFWTAGEVEAARLLSQRYFLYLMPVLKGQTFDLSKIIIIQNPYDSVYRSKEEWAVEPEVLSCYKKHKL